MLPDMNMLMPRVPQPRLPWAGGMSAYGRSPQQFAPRLDEEEEESLLGTGASRAGSGVAAMGSLLDLPGSMIRDTAGLLSTGDFNKYNPLDQLLSPFSAQNRATGRDL